MFTLCVTFASKLHNVVKTVDLSKHSWDQTPCQKLKGEFEGLYEVPLKSLRLSLTCSKSGVGIFKFDFMACHTRMGGPSWLCVG